MSVNTKPALLIYYEGAYGPTIIVATGKHEHLIAVRRLFDDLASGEAVVEDFATAVGCRSIDIESLMVQAVRDPRKDKVLELKSRGVGGPVFCWTNSAEGWMDCIEMVDAMIRLGSPCHQYLTCEGRDDALVTLSFEEYDLDTGILLPLKR